MYDVNYSAWKRRYARVAARWTCTRAGSSPTKRTGVECRWRSSARISKEALFANVDPIGKDHQRGRPRISGDRHDDPPRGIFFGETDNRVLLPYFTMQKLYPNAQENAHRGQRERGQAAASAWMKSARCLRIDRRVPYNKPDNFALSTAEQMVERFPPDHSDDVAGDGRLSSIGLLVGGIGVMNIMLVSVTERTRRSASAKPSAPGDPTSSFSSCSRRWC